jgi:hypothetical protein
MTAAARRDRTTRSPRALGTGARPVLAVSVVAVLALGSTLVVLDQLPAEAADPPVSLGTTGSFSVLGAETVTNTGPSVLGQSLGVHPGTTAPGFPPGIVGGEVHLGDAVALQAKSDLTAAYGDAAGRTPFISLPAELGGQTLTPGTYRLPAAQLTGTLTLDTLGDPAAVFVFQLTSGLTTATDSEVAFLGDAASCNVYWQIAESAVIGTGTDFVGTVMASTSISMASGATLEGRALAQTGEVTLINNTITAPVCDVPTPTDTPTETPSPTDTPAPTDTPTVTPVPTVAPSDTPAPVTPAPPTGPTPGAGIPPGSGQGPSTPAGARRTSPAVSDRYRDEDLSATGAGSTPLLLAAGVLVVLGITTLAVRRRKGQS